MNTEPTATTSPRRNRAIRLFVSSLLLLAFTALPARAENCDTCGFGSASKWAATYDTAYGWKGDVYGVKFTVHFQKSYPNTSKLWVESVTTEIWGQPEHPWVSWLALKTGDKMHKELRPANYTVAPGKTYFNSGPVPLRQEVAPDPALGLYFRWQHDCDLGPNGASCPSNDSPSDYHWEAMLPIRDTEYVEQSEHYPGYKTCRTQYQTAYACRYRIKAERVPSSGGGTSGPTRPEAPEIPGTTNTTVN
jgi:hypothetical protein